MAKRRMISLDIIDKDAFISMSQTAQNLYFHIVGRADDDGFCGNIFGIMRLLGSSMDDLSALINRRFLLECKDGVLVVKHWWILNQKRKDRYTPSVYLKDNLLYLDENNAYTEKVTAIPYSSAWQPSGNQAVTQDKLSKDKISKNKLIEDKLSLVKDNECLSNKGESILAQQYIAKLHELGVTDHDKVIVDYFNNDGDPMRVSNLITELKTNKELNINEFLESF